MKITKHVRVLHQEVFALNKLLESKVKELFESKKRSQWFFLSRVKEIESYALKLETGRVPDPKAMEDFFACTLVVENRSAIAEALQLVDEVCDIRHRRPKIDTETHKSPENFTFDDLRLYVTLKASDQLPATPVDLIVFEIQIKTFLQHAWGIATHDLVYKGQSVHWGRARVAYQIKAMLEHAEISVEQVDSLAESTLLSVTDEKLRNLKRVIDWLKETWDPEWLPKDLVRLSENVISLASALKVPIDVLIKCVETDTKNGQGSQLTELTPYAAIVRSLYNNCKDKLVSYLQSESGKFKILISNDPDLALDIRNIDKVRPSKYLILDDEVDR